MESTIIAIMLAVAVVFWNAPFTACFIPLNLTWQRLGRHLLFGIVLLLLIMSQTHTAPADIPAPSCGSGIASCDSLIALTLTTFTAPLIF